MMNHDVYCVECKIDLSEFDVFLGYGKTRIYGEDRSTGEEVERCAAAATIKHLEDRLHLDIIDYTYNSFLAHKSDLLKIESMKMKYVGLACEVERAMKKMFRKVKDVSNCHYEFCHHNALDLGVHEEFNVSYAISEYSE